MNAKEIARYFVDTEFIERGAHNPVDLISIGIVAEDGREYYAISAEFNEQDCNEWGKANVLPNLGQRQRRNQSRGDDSALAGNQAPRQEAES